MPALVTCQDHNLLETQWNVGSDDFVVPAFISIVFSLVSSTLVMAALAALWLSPYCDDTPLHPLIYSSFFIILAIEVAIMINEAVIMSVSYRGSIWNPITRETVSRYLYIRIFLSLLEIAGSIVCTVASFSPAVTEHMECNSYRVAIGLARASAILLWIKVVTYQLRFCLFLDPCGCFTPGLLQHLSFLDQADDSGDMPTPFLRERADSWFQRIFHLRRPSFHSTFEVPEMVDGRLMEERRVRFWQRQVSVTQAFRGGITPEDFKRQVSRVHRSHIGLRRLERRLRVLFCCLCVGGHRSRGIAVEDIARALYTLFDFEEDGKDSDVRLVLSDVIAGFKLLHRYQTDKMERLSEGKRLEDKFREVTFDNMPRNQKPHYRYKRPKPLAYADTKLHLMVDNMIYYMHYAMGIYGWSLHVFSNMTCGLCQLAVKTCCVCKCCRHHDPERFHLEDRCMCGVAAMRQQTSIEEEDVYYISMDNKIYKAPFAVCVDHNMKSVVISVRGTLSIKDALTDMSYSLHYVEVAGVNETYVHKGMYAAADEIVKKLVGRTREEIRLEKSKTQKEVPEEEVERSLSTQRKILNEIYSQEKHKDYQLIITGHSLGAGVASVLAFLLRKHYPDLHCYAFSAPGCVFSYPLACFSKKFITTVVLGNDVIPRVSFRSLLHLKQSVKHLLEHCTRPKCRVIFEPKWCDNVCCKATQRNTLPDGFEKRIVTNKTTDKSLQNAVFPPAKVTLAPPDSTRTFLRSPDRSFDVLTPQTFARKISDHVTTELGRFMPTFPPGKIYHLKVTKNAKPCFLGCCYPSEMDMERVRNEDLCMIIMDRGIVEDHMPHHVMDSLMRFKKQCIMPHYVQEKVDELKIKREMSQRDRREAREKTSITGQWVFPCGGHVAGDGTESGEKQRQEHLIATEPCDELSVHSPSRHTHHPEMSLHTPCSSDSEDEISDEDSPRTVEVEVHIDAPSDGSVKQELGRQRRFEFDFPVHNETKPSGGADHDEEQTTETSAQRPKLQREQNIHSNSGADEPDMKMEHPLMKTRSANKSMTKQVSIAEAPPTVIPVQVPFCPSPVPPTKRPKLTLPVRQNSSSRKYFPQISQGSATPSTVLTLEARRGFKLKLKVPTEERTTTV